MNEPHPPVPTPLSGTFSLSMESDELFAWWMRYVCSMYSEMRCRKLSGSLKTTGMVILDSSWRRRRVRNT